MLGKKTLKGKYQPINPQKYRGDPQNITYRSSWERKFMRYLDLHPEITAWGSEEIVIPYFDPTHGRNRRYFPDFVFRTKDGKVHVVEIKPYKECVAPEAKRKTKRFLAEAAEYKRNKAKWTACHKYCRERGWIFKILTERHIPGFL